MFASLLEPMLEFDKVGTSHRTSHHTTSHHILQSLRSTAAIALTHPWLLDDADDVEMERMCCEHYGYKANLPLPRIDADPPRYVFVLWRFGSGSACT